LVLRTLNRYKLRDRDTRRRLLEALNTSTAPEGAPVSGGSGEMKVLKEMNELQEFENDNWSRGAV
jgi:hypothetical protein